MLLAYMTCDVGAHHNRSWAITYELQVGRDLVVPEKVARIIRRQNFRPMFDVLGACRLQWVELAIERSRYEPALEAITGVARTWADPELVGTSGTSTACTGRVSTTVSIGLTTCRRRASTPSCLRLA